MTCYFDPKMPICSSIKTSAKKINDYPTPNRRNVDEELGSRYFNLEMAVLAYDFSVGLRYLLLCGFLLSSTFFTFFQFSDFIYSNASAGRFPVREWAHG